jgi:hypothetical protein
MSRSGYTDDGECYELNLYRANVDRALGGKRGQAFLKELLAALDVMPEKKLIAYDFVVEPPAPEDEASPYYRPRECGVCALASVGLARKMDMSGLDEGSDPEWVGMLFGISGMMAAEIEYMNDEACLAVETSEERWARMRRWVTLQILDEVA